MRGSCRSGRRANLVGDPAFKPGGSSKGGESPMVRPVSQAASLQTPTETDHATPGSVPTARLPFGLTLGLFVVSGATGLVDQLCFSKYLGYVVGGTAHAVSAVLA